MSRIPPPSGTPTLPLGVGVARQRKAIVDGLRDSISQFSGNVEGSTLLSESETFDLDRCCALQAKRRDRSAAPDAVFRYVEGRGNAGWNARSLPPAKEKIPDWCCPRRAVTSSGW